MMRRKSHRPVISIIVPIYNVELYLKECIDSILNQNFHDFELILVNDGSIDRCASICYEYKEKYDFLSIIDQSNKGLSMARNMGMNKANGQYIMFIDPDDSIKPNSLYDINHIISNRAPDVIVGQIEGIPEKGVNRKFFEQMISPCTINGIPISDAILTLVKSGISISPSVRYIVKKEMIVQNGLWFSSIWHEDQEWSPKLLIFAKTLWMYPRKFYNYRLRNDSLSTHKSFQVYKDYCEIIIRFYSLSLKIPDSKKVEFLYRRCAYLLKKIGTVYESFNIEERNQIMEFVESNKYIITIIIKYLQKDEYPLFITK